MSDSLRINEEQQKDSVKMNEPSRATQGEDARVSLVADYGKPPYQGTRLRAVRVDDELWSNAVTISQKLGDGGVSAEIRRALERYVKRHRDLLEEDEGVEA